jgi:hypothetical protein
MPNHKFQRDGVWKRHSVAPMNQRRRAQLSLVAPPLAEKLGSIGPFIVEVQHSRSRMFVWDDPPALGGGPIRFRLIWRPLRP